MMTAGPAPTVHRPDVILSGKAGVIVPGQGDKTNIAHIRVFRPDFTAIRGLRQHLLIGVTVPTIVGFFAGTNFPLHVLEQLIHLPRQAFSGSDVPPHQSSQFVGNSWRTWMLSEKLQHFKCSCLLTEVWP